MNFTNITKGLIVTSLLLTTTTTFAAKSAYKDKMVFKDKPACPAIAYLQDGFYVGIQPSYTTVNNVEKLTSFDTVFSASTTYYNSKLGTNGWSGGIYLGDGRYFQNFYYLGAEIFGNLSSNFATSSNTIPSSSDTIDTTNGQLTVGNNYGISIIPGISVNEHSLLYVRLGYKWTNFKYQATVATTDPVVSSVSTTKTMGGFNSGVGIETLIAGNWSVRAEYTYTNYGSENIGFANNNETTNPYNVNISPSDNQFSLGVTYHIA